MRIAEDMRGLFREPLGRLIPDGDITREVIAGELEGGMLVTVGDATTQRVLEYGILPHIQIVDGLERRAKRSPPGGGGVRTIRCANPPGGITRDSVSAVDSALASPDPLRILVDGEEDLLVLPVCAGAPGGAVVMYGQPGRGLVVVRVDQRIRDKANSLIGMMDGT